MLAIGQAAPDFALPDEDGTLRRLADFRGQRVVLFFYPKDNTLVCTIEVCAFRDAYADLHAKDAVVLGVSSDTIPSHKGITERWRLPYRLLSDPDGAVRKAFDVGRTFGLFPGRVTYIIDKEGIVCAAVDDPLRASVHVKEALRTLDAQRTS